MSASARSLRENLDIVAMRHRVDGILVSDEDGLLIGSTSACLNPESLAASAPFLVESRDLSSSTPVPTAARSVSLGDYDVVVAVVGDPKRCRAALRDAERPVSRALRQ